LTTAITAVPRHDVQINLYKSTITPAAICAADTWKGTTKISHMLDVFHTYWASHGETTLLKTSS